jgi:hypothetical protein
VCAYLINKLIKKILTPFFKPPLDNKKYYRGDWSPPQEVTHCTRCVYLAKACITWKETEKALLHGEAL